jgi:hypothetical protein
MWLFPRHGDVMVNDRAQHLREFRDVHGVPFSFC